MDHLREESLISWMMQLKLTSTLFSKIIFRSQEHQKLCWRCQVVLFPSCDCHQGTIAKIRFGIVPMRMLHALLKGQDNKQLLPNHSRLSPPWSFKQERFQASFCFH
jgi:hypothetical protein